MAVGSEEIKICPKCGKTTVDYREHMFTGTDPYVRDYGNYIQCKGCNYQGLSKEETDAK